MKNLNTYGIEKEEKTDDVISGKSFSGQYCFSVGSDNEVFVFCQSAEQAYHFFLQLGRQSFSNVFIFDAYGTESTEFCSRMYKKYKESMACSEEIEA